VFELFSFDCSVVIITLVKSWTWYARLLKTNCSSKSTTIELSWWS